MSLRWTRLPRRRDNAAKQPPEAAPQPFRIGEIVLQRAAAAQARGLPVAVVGQLTAEAIGSATLTAQALDALLLDAERHGAARRGRPITVELASAGRRVIVRVSDHRPDRPGVRGTGVHVARALLVQQGGELQDEQHPAGACFALSLPLAVVDV